MQPGGGDGRARPHSRRPLRATPKVSAETSPRRSGAVHRRHLRLLRRRGRAALPGRPLRAKGLPAAEAQRARRVDVESPGDRPGALPASRCARGRGRRPRRLHHGGREGRRPPRRPRLRGDVQPDGRGEMARCLFRDAARGARSHPPRQRRTRPRPRARRRPEPARDRGGGARCRAVRPAAERGRVGLARRRRHSRDVEGGGAGGSAFRSRSGRAGRRRRTAADRRARLGRGARIRRVAVAGAPRPRQAHDPRRRPRPRQVHALLRPRRADHARDGVA